MPKVTASATGTSGARQMRLMGGSVSTTGTAGGDRWTDRGTLAIRTPREQRPTIGQSRRSAWSRSRPRWVTRPEVVRVVGAMQCIKSLAPRDFRPQFVGPDGSLAAGVGG